MMFLTTVLFAVLPISTLALPAHYGYRYQRRQDPTDTGNVTDTATPNNPDPQNSLTLLSSVIATGFLNNGQAVQEAGQVASLTSGNNFINFCATVPQLPITNGKQITTGSCNPAPMGLIPSTANMPSAKFVSPTNFGAVQANTNFTIQLSITGMQTGFFVNAQQNYFAAPQQLNSAGQIIGHSHVVIESISSFQQTTPTDPTKFAFFKGLNAAADANGILTATANLPIGFYKISSINTAANHQPALVPVAQHGSLDDAVYFAVTADGQPDPSAGAPASATASGAGAASSAASAITASSSAAAAAAAAAPPAASAASAAAAGASAASAAAAAAPASSSAAAADAAAAGAAPAAADPGAGGRHRHGHHRNGRRFALYAY